MSKNIFKKPQIFTGGGGNGVNTATQTALNLKEDVANKSTNVNTDQASDIKYPSVKAVYDWATGLFATISNLALKANIASPTFTGTPAAPTATINSNNTTLANTEYVDRLSINFYNVKAYGAVGDGTTDDSAAILATITASIAASGNANIIFPNGVYKVNTQIDIDNLTANVYIIGNGATLKSGISVVASSLLKISSAASVYIEDLKINFNAITAIHYGIRIGDYANTKRVGVARISNCDFYNFGVENQRGILVENTPATSGLTSRNTLPAIIIKGCNFYNLETFELFSINYSTATLYGIGIELGEYSDNAIITECNFNWIRVGIFSTAGANVTISNNNFICCLPKLSGVYTFGVIYIPNTGTNNGKVNIIGNKMNHNYGYCVYSKYATAERPMTITGNQFIANCTTAIYATHTSAVYTRHNINDNYFERCSQAFSNSLTGQPFGATLQPFIYLSNQKGCAVKNNMFLNDATYGVQTASSSTENYIENNIWNSITGIATVVGTNVISENKTSTSIYSNNQTIFDNYATVGNVTTTETDLYTFTTLANTLSNNGEKIITQYGGTFVASATATRQIKIYFGGTAIFDTGALTISSNSSWVVDFNIIRVSSSIIRYNIAFNTQNAALSAYTASGELTGLTLSGTNILKITGTAAGGGAASNDIIAISGTGRFLNAAN